LKRHPCENPFGGFGLAKTSAHFSKNLQESWELTVFAETLLGALDLLKRALFFKKFAGNVGD